MFSMLLFLAVLFLFCMITSRKVIMTPQMGFSAGFLISVGYATMYIKRWGLRPTLNTCFVICGGVLLFCAVSWLMQFLYAFVPVYQKKSNVEQKLEIFGRKNEKTVANWKLIFMILFQIGTLGGMILFMRRLTHGSLTDSIYYFRHSMFTTQKLELPKLLFHARALSIASSYVWMYLLLKNIIFQVKNKANTVYLIANLLISCIMSVMLGGRGGLVQILIAFVVQMYFVVGDRRQWKNTLSIKMVFIILLIGVGILLLFQAFGTLLGRTSNMDIGEYLAVYISAEIKNLDTFIRIGEFGSDLNHNQTFISLINAFSGKLGLPNMAHDLDLPFRYYGTHALGNVATTFLPFLYDYGYAGVVLLVPPMAAFSQALFQHAVRGKRNSNHAFSFTIVLYSYVFFTIFFSLFSNKFYENIVSINFLYTLLYWEIIQIFLSRKLVLRF